MLWRDTLTKNPDCWLGWNNVGLDLLEKGQIDDAISSFDRSLAINPNDPEALYNLGNAELQKGNLEAAVAPVPSRAGYKLQTSPKPKATSAIRFFKPGKQQKQSRTGSGPWTLSRRTPPRLTISPGCWQRCPVDLLRDGPKAVALAQRADQLTGGANPRVLEPWQRRMQKSGDFRKLSERRKQR